MADRIQLNQKSYAKLSRRGLILGGLQMAFITGLAFRMRKLQVEEASEYRLLADENRINIRLKIGRAHVRTPVTRGSRMPSSA